MTMFERLIVGIFVLAGAVMVALVMTIIVVAIIAVLRLT